MTGEADARDALMLLGEIAAEMAHELQNSLQVVSSSAYVGRVAVERGDAAAALPYLAKIEGSVRTAQDLVESLLALARGEPPRLEPVPLRAVLETARAGIEPGAARWTDELESADAEVLAHATLLPRLFHALYDNAIRASAPRAPAIVTRSRAGNGGRVVVEVSDDGPGVSPAVAARVFEPLVTSRSGGTGLGLALATRIARAHRGSVELVASSGGATFRVDLPGA